ncbi:MAG: TPM domain-containing protein [Emergencia sp.]
MKKRIIIIALTLLLALAAVPGLVFAEGSNNILFADPACTVSDAELESLNAKLDEISERQKCEVVIYTTRDYYGETAQEYADGYYDQYSYGYGSDRSGILLVINSEERSYAISTCGFGITAFTDAGLNYIVEQIKPALSEGDYATALNTYADLCDQFLTQARTGEPYDNGNLPGQEKKIDKVFVDIPVGVGAGLLIAFILAGRDKSALRTVRRKEEAAQYLRPGSLQLTNRGEQFLYNNVETVVKESSGGGSTTHTSSSGEEHGGTSGSF